MSLLRSRGVAALVASRRSGADVHLDVEDPDSLRMALRREDVVVDAAGPFQERSSALLEAALERQVDLVDLSDSLTYAELVYDRAGEIERRGVRVLTSCGAISAVAAALVEASGVANPARASALLVPASRHTASPATVRALLASTGRPVRVWRDARLVEADGWSESRRFRLPARRGHLVESAASRTLPASWPSLRAADFWVDPHLPLAARALSLPAVRVLLRRAPDLARLFATAVGSSGGAFAVEVEARDGETAALALSAPRRSFLTAVAPAVLAAQALAEGSFVGQGVIPAHRQVPAATLLAYLRELGLRLGRVEWREPAAV